ncbi:hypothetical protein [Ekhidna sp.]|uniref:hypothetical protein n=1 Tax=Ekhidna sp. TaxID=2608089 RepID=UPI0032EBD86D
MKKVLTTLAIALSVSTVVFGQSCPVPKALNQEETLGVWKGAYSLNGEFVNFTLRVSELNGVLRASVDVPKLLISKASYDIKICDSEELHIKNTSVSTSIEFIGRPNEKGTMSGRVIIKQNGEVASREVFTVKRTAKS